MQLHVQMFGELRAYRDKQPAYGFQTRKTAALFAYLAFYSHKKHSRELLADMLWPDAETESGRHRLAQALFALRSQLEKSTDHSERVLSIDRTTMRVLPGEVVVDALEFKHALHSASLLTDPDRRNEALVAALHLYTDDFLTGFYDDWVLTERQRFNDQFVDTSRQVIKYFEGKNLYDKAIEHCRAALTTAPLAEDISEDLMRLLALSGQPGTALSYYRDLERVMLKELGEPPSGPIRSLMERIRSAPTISTDNQPLAEYVESNLPVPLTRFFGRQEELSYITSLLESGKSRLITITGMGGSGKTRLSIEAASMVTEMFSGAVYFVTLAELGRADQIGAEIARVVCLAQPSNGALALVTEFLKRRKTLLILDNLEHVQDGALPLIQHLLKRIPKLFLIITSRAKLALMGEREIPLPPLQTPSDLLTAARQIDSQKLAALDIVRLFVDRAQAVRPEFAVTEKNALAVAKVCEKLEGLPLAIELCAAWAKVLTPEQMLTQLDSRFDLLESRDIDIPERHRSLRAAMEYSHALLPKNLQELFVSLCIFRSGWTLEAAGAICIDSIRSKSSFSMVSGLSDLHNRSLILTQLTQSGDEMRYRMLETVREFTSNLLIDDSRRHLSEKHAFYYLELAERAESLMTAGNQMTWLQRLDDDHDNLRTALSWFHEHGTAEQNLRIAAALTQYWDMRGYVAEGKGYLEEALAFSQKMESSEHLKPFLAKALVSYASLLRVQGNNAKVYAAARQGLQFCREINDVRGIAGALQVLAVLTYTGEDCDEARGYLEEGLALARDLNDRSLLALSLVNLGNIALEQAQFDEAEALYTEAVTLYQDDGNQHQTARLLNNLGALATFRKEFETADRYIQESLTISRALRNYAGIALCQHNLGDLQRQQGNYDEDIRLQLEAAALAHRLGENRLITFAARELGQVYCRTGKYQDGISLLAAAEVLRSSSRLSFKPADPAELEEALDLCRTAIGDKADAVFCSALQWSQGRAMECALSALQLID
jgi:predicted ATPase/DNA-binding SARP family transcriptional activator